MFLTWLFLVVLHHILIKNKEVLLNAKLEIMKKHANSNGVINWKGGAGAHDGDRITKSDLAVAEMAFNAVYKSADSYGAYAPLCSVLGRIRPALRAKLARVNL